MDHTILLISFKISQMMCSQTRLKSSLLTTMKFEKTGHDGNPIRFQYLKPVVGNVTSPLVHVINTCIDNKIFPSIWKIARVCPVPKVDHGKDVTEFRPIPILFILFKVFDELYCISCVSF